MRKLLAALALTVFVACRGDSVTNIPLAEVVGTYNLSTVNGAGLPFVIQATGPKVELLSDSYVLSSAGTFRQSSGLRLTSGDTVSLQTGIDSGSFSVQGSTVVFTFFSDGTSSAASVGGGILAFTATNGGNAVYVKQ